MATFRTIQADIRVQNGKTAVVGENLEKEAEELIIGASGKQVFPRMIEAHCHLGMEENATRGEGNDINEMSDPIMPQIRAIGGCGPLDETTINACDAGVIMAAISPGSASIIGGTFMTYRTHSVSIDKMVVRNPVAMKYAFGENPEHVYQGNRIKTRTNITALLRKTLAKIKRYIAKRRAANNDPLGMPSYGIELEVMIPVVKKEPPLKCHVYHADDILMVIRTTKEFDVNVILDHYIDGEVIKAQVKASEYPATVEPSPTYKSKFEPANKSFTTPNVLYREGILIAITANSPVVSQEYLPLCVALAMRDGLSEEGTLKAIAVNPARILGLGKRTGNIERSKDRDIIICDSSLPDIRNVIHYAIINGEIAYQKAQTVHS